MASRPTIDPTALVSSEEAWDALLRDIITAMAVYPLPLPRFLNVAALPDPAAYEDCMACTQDHDVYYSDGSEWFKMTKEALP